MFHRLDSSWPRQKHFQHYMNNVRCTFSLTVQIDVTRLRAALKTREIKAYPAQIYLLATAVNRFWEFRMGLSETGEPGFWEVVHPACTVFNRSTKTFSSIWTPYEKEFRQFYKSCVADLHRYGDTTELVPQDDTPPNVFDISSVPWIDFTAFDLNVYTEGTHLLPIFTIGRYVEQRGKTLMPLALQLHHAACDGYHAGQFIEAVRDMAWNCDSWLSCRSGTK